MATTRESGVQHFDIVCSKVRLLTLSIIRSGICGLWGAGVDDSRSVRCLSGEAREQAVSTRLDGLEREGSEYARDDRRGLCLRVQQSRERVAQQRLECHE